MSICWKCKIKIKEFQIHHVDGNHENDNFNNKVYLCNKCHDLIQGICNNCKKQQECYAAYFNICWEDVSKPPPVYFEIKPTKRTITCKSSILIKDGILSFICINGMIRGVKKYPCYYSAGKDGCAKDSIPQKVLKLMEDEEYRNLLKSFRELENIIDGKNLND